MIIEYFMLFLVTSLLNFYQNQAVIFLGQQLLCIIIYFCTSKDLLNGALLSWISLSSIVRLESSVVMLYYGENSFPYVPEDVQFLIGHFTNSRNCNTRSLFQKRQGSLGSFGALLSGVTSAQRCSGRDCGHLSASEYWETSTARKKNLRIENWKRRATSSGLVLRDRASQPAVYVAL